MSPRSIEVAEFVVAAAGVHALAGLLFALPFLAWGVARIDPVAQHGSLGFRLAILPGVVALWPLLAWAWWRGRGFEERNAHRRAARGDRS